jgi:hypothetical protein
MTADHAPVFTMLKRRQFFCTSAGTAGDSGGLSVSDSLSSPGLGALGLGPPRPLAGPPAANPLGGRPPADDIKAELRRAGVYVCIVCVTWEQDGPQGGILGQF